MKHKIYMLFLMIIIATLNLNAQEQSIIFNDYVPDITLDNHLKDTLKIDLNYDSVNDVVFYLMYPSYGRVLIIEPLHNDCLITINNWNTSDTLNQALDWISKRWFFQWEPNGGEIGIKLKLNGQNYYGWIKAYYKNFELETFWYVDKYAFCTIPDYPLMWGQTELTGKKDIKIQDKIKVTVDGLSKNINIQSKDVVMEISLINSSGRVIRKWRNIKSSKVDIPSEGIRGGVYFMRIKTENDKIVTEKIVL